MFRMLGLILAQLIIATDTEVMIGTDISAAHVGFPTQRMLGAEKEGMLQAVDAFGSG